MSSAPFVHWVHFPTHYNDYNFFLKFCNHRKKYHDINKKLKKKIETKGDKVLVLSQGQFQSNTMEL